jgi:hypothetical protein
MSHTPEQRDGMNLCAAKKKNGEKCRAFAGQGTGHFGSGKCRWHLGNTPSHHAHAVKQEAHSRMVEFGQPIDVDPAAALLGVLHLSAGHLNWVRAELAAMDDKTTFEAQVLLRLFDGERDRIARIAKAALDVGVAEQTIQLVERYGEALAAMLRAIFFDSDLDLTAAQRGRLPDVLRKHLTTVTAEPQSALVA